MKKYKMLLIGCITIGIASVVSCKKPAGTPSAASMITGNWKITSEYIDTNGNGKMDPNELFPDTSESHRVITFNSNGSGMSVYYGTTDAFSWALSNNNTYLTTVDTSGGAFLHIDQLTSASMTLKDTTGGIDEWEVFTKQ